MDMGFLFFKGLQEVPLPPLLRVTSILTVAHTSERGYIGDHLGECYTGYQGGY